MFNIFKNLFKMSTKQEPEQQLGDAIAVAQRLSKENKTLKVYKVIRDIIRLRKKNLI